MNDKSIILLRQVIELLTTKEVRPTLDEIIKDGQTKIHDAVECVISKHDMELQKISTNAKAESDSRWDGFVRNEQARRMAALSRDRYLDQLVMAQNRSTGVGVLGGLQFLYNKNLSSLAGLVYE